jgi:septal ring factor EnvC (AmiA/AmiB activator)
MFTKTLVAAALLASLVAPLAASADGEVEQRIDNQQHRINQGVRNGSLTQREYRRLDNGLDRIEAQRRRDLRDGKLSPAEYRQLNREENRLSDNIYFQKHDRQHQRRHR